MRLTLSVLVAISTLTSAGSAKVREIVVTELESPAGANSFGASFATGPDGSVWMSWIEGVAPSGSAGEHGHEPRPRQNQPAVLRLASLSTDGRSSQAQPITSDPTLGISHADIPQVAFDGRGNAFAVWTDGRGGAFFARRGTDATTWSKPEPWVAGRHEMEKFSLTRLAGGDVLAVWLDGRDRLKGGAAQQLFARVLGDHSEDRLVDTSVCDCCQAALAPFLDGGALTAYRGRTSDEVRDILTARYRGNAPRAWEDGRVLNHDDWRINACPVNGPRLSTDGSRVAAAWFTAADNEPRVLVSYSPDAGARWLMPLRLDGRHPVGHVDVALLRDGAIVALWLEADGSVWLERVTPEFAPTQPLQLAAAGSALTRCFPRLAVLADYAGGGSSARLIVAYTQPFESATRVRTAVVTIPEGDLLVAERTCNCAPTAEQLQGFPVRGVVVDADPAGNRARVRHLEVPGVFAAGTREFQVAPETLSTLKTSREFLGRIDRQNGVWWLFDVRFLGDPRP